MFKIDKKKATSFACAFVLASSLCLVSCGDKKDSEYRENDLKYVSVEEATGFALNYNDGVSIIIPYESCRILESGVVWLSVNTYDGENYGRITYDSSELMFVGDYDRTYNYACTISDEVYLYSDVVNGNPVNLISNDIKKDDNRTLK